MSTSSAPNPTAASFGYPETLVCDYRHWVVLTRPRQCTLGALVLICTDRAEAFSNISQMAFAELETAVGDIEAGLTEFCDYRKINYLMLMMKDKDVHFHVLPRHDADREFAGLTFRDAGWPGIPDLAGGHELSPDDLAALTQSIRSAWPRAKR